MGNFWGILFGLALICIGFGAVIGINLWRFFFPILLILLGINILFNQMGWKHVNKPIETHESIINYDTVF